MGNGMKNAPKTYTNIRLDLDTAEALKVRFSAGWHGYDNAVRRLLGLPIKKSASKPGKQKSANRLRVEALEIGEVTELLFAPGTGFNGDPAPMRCVHNVTYATKRQFHCWMEGQRLMCRRDA